MKEDRPNRYIVPVLAKGLDVLESFRSLHEELALKDVIERTGISHSTAFRILHTLVQRGYLVRSGRKYRRAVAAQRPRIGYAALSDRVAISCAIAESLRAAAKWAGMDLIVLNNEQNPDRAIENAREFVQEQVSIAIEFQNVSEVAPLIADIYAGARIPAISIHMPQPGSIYFGPNNYRAGQTAGVTLGEYAAREWRGAFDLAVLLGVPTGGELLHARMTGVVAGIEEKLGPLPASKIVHIAGGEDKRAARSAFCAAIRDRRRKKKLLVSAVSDDLALGALEGVREMGLQATAAIVGIDGSPRGLQALREPRSPFIGTVAFFPETYGPQLVRLATSILRGEQVAPAIHVRHELITRRHEGTGSAGVRD